MKTLTTPFIVLAATLCFVACDSKQENAREDALEKKADQMENKADAIRDAGERKADAIESQKALSKPAVTNDRLENAADATRKATENAADKLENKADAVREQK